VTAVTIHYTSRTYRTLALPTIVPLMRERRRLPSRSQLRAGLAPGVAFALVGLEALVVVAGTTTLQTGASTDLIILLAVLAPVNRVGFEWARLLYFDLKKLDVPLLRTLRDRFDRAARRLALLMGVVTWLFAAVGVFVVGGLSAVLVGGLLAMFVARSLLAAAQIQAFSSESYERLTVVGGFGVLALVGLFRATRDDELLILAIAAILAVSFVMLLLSARGGRHDRPLVSLPDFFLALRRASGPVTVTRLSFDTRLDVRGTTAEARRAELARRDAAADRIARRVARSAGAAAWSSPIELWTFATAAAAAAPDPAELVRLAGGLVDRAPLVSSPDNGLAAARELAAIATRGTTPPASATALIADFARRFPSGICYDLSVAPPAALKQLPAEQRSEMYRDALAFAGQLKPSRRLDEFDVTALAVDGTLRAVFIVDKATDERLRRTWRNLLRDQMVRASAGLEEVVSGESVPAVAAPSGARML
jgi:hypothetical protein